MLSRNYNLNPVIDVRPTLVGVHALIVRQNTYLETTF